MKMLQRILALFAGKPLALRSPRWRDVRSEWLCEHGECEACMTKESLEVHHKRPLHLYPELELDSGNLITLCERNGCHFLIGHGRDWKAFNPDVVSDAKLVRGLIRGRRYERTDVKP